MWKLNFEKKIEKRILISSFLLHQVLTIFLLAQHELWRDELQAWSIAQSSSSPIDIIQNTKFEGRPPLWQLLLWPLTKLSDNPETMKVVTFVIGCITLWLWLSQSSVSIFLRITISFGFLFTGGYFLHSRDYALMMMLLFISIYSTNRDPLAARSIIALCLLSLVNLFALIMSGAIVLAAVLSPSVRRFKNGTSREKITTTFGIISLSSVFTFSVYTIFPKPESQFGVGAYISWSKPLANAVFPFISAYEPNYSLTAASAVAVLSALCLGLGFVNRRAFIFFLSACLVLSLNSSFGFAFYWWHWGAIPIAAFSTSMFVNERPHSRFSSVMILGSVGVFMLSGLFANWRGPGEQVYGSKPYSMSKATAAKLQGICASDCTMIVDWDATGAALSAHLGGQSLYYLNRQEFGTYAKFVRTNVTPTWEQALVTMNQFERPILVTTDLLLGAIPPEFELVEIVSDGVWDNALILLLADNLFETQ